MAVDVLDAPRVRPRPGGARLIGSLTGHAIASFVRAPAATFFTLIFPVTFLVLVGAMVGGEEVEDGVHVSQYLVAPFLVFGVAESAFCVLAIHTATLRDNGVFQRLRGTPVPARVTLASLVAAATVMAVASAAVLVVVGVTVYDVQIVGDKVPAALLTLAVGIVCCAALGLAVVSIARSVLAVQALTNGVLIPLAFISNVFMVGVELPAPLDWLSRALPLRHFADAMLETFDPLTSGNGFRWGDLAMMAAWAGAGAIVAVRRFGWEPRGSARVPRLEPSPVDSFAGTLTAARDAGRPSPWRLLRTQLGHDLTGMRRERLPVFFAVVMPAGLLLLFPAVVPADRLNGLPFENALLAGMVAYGIAVAGYVNLPESLAHVRAGGVLKRLRATPFPPWLYLGGRLLGTLLLATALTVTLLAVATLAHGFRLDPARLPLLIGAVAATTACFGLLGLALLTLMPTARTVTAVTLGTLVPLSFLSDVFYVGAELPRSLQLVGSVFPLKHAVALFTAALRPDAGPGFGWTGLAVVAAWTAAAAGLAARMPWYEKS
jgi:ABC-2 type transport system permease protein